MTAGLVNSGPDSRWESADHRAHTRGAAWGFLVVDLTLPFSW